MSPLSRARRLLSCLGLSAAVAWSVACGGVDRVFEGPQKLDAYISVSIDSLALTLPQSGTRAFPVTMTRVGAFAGAVTLLVERLPDGVTAAVDSQRTNGAVTTAYVTLAASAAAQMASFSVLLRVQGERVNDATQQMLLNVTPPLSFAFTADAPSATIARGGIARSAVRLARTNFSTPIALSMDGDAHITAEFASNPAPNSGTNTSVALTMHVAGDTPAGTYPMVLRARGDGVADRTVPLSVTVTSDALQLLPTSTLQAPQAGSAQGELIVNRSASLGAIAFTAEQLPVGVTASVAPLSGGSAVTTLTLSAGAESVPGSYTMVVRGKATGVPDATATVPIIVTPAGITLALGASSMDVFQSLNGRVTASIARQDYTGDVNVSVDNVPAGLSVVATPTPTSGNSVSIAVAATASVAPGTYALVVRAQPTALGASAERRATLNVTVRPLSAGGGNVLLDWTACTPPAWVAAQDGDGAWQPLTLSSGAARFNVTTGKGAFAYLEDASSVVVRFMTQAELTAAPIALCAEPPATKSVRGVSAHTTLNETWTYRMGGGLAQTTTLAPEFIMSGVRNGMHDLVGWTPLGNVYRAMLRRDLDIPDGESVGLPLSLAGGESFSATRSTLTIANSAQSTESLTHSVAFLTTGACTNNLLYTSLTGGTTQAMWGIPDAVQRPTDYHVVTVTSAGTGIRRTVSASFHSMVDRVLTLPATFAAPALQSVSTTAKRLRATIPALPGAYNESIELRYSDGAHAADLLASVAYTGTSNIVLTMPDFSTVGQFPASAIMGPNASGSWFVLASGSTPGTSACVENRLFWQLFRTGTF